MAGPRPWPRLAFWITQPLASRRFSPAIPTPRWSGSVHRRLCCWCKIPHPGVGCGRDAPGAKPTGRVYYARQVSAVPRARRRAAVLMGRDAADAALGTLTIDLARQPERPSRPVPLSVTAKPVTLHGARRLGGTLPPVTVSAVSAQEPSPPPGEAPVEWLLLTSLPVTDVPRACLVVQWSRCRWEMDLFFRVLKQGWQIEQLRMQREPRLLHAPAIY